MVDLAKNIVSFVVISVAVVVGLYLLINGAFLVAAVVILS